MLQIITTHQELSAILSEILLTANPSSTTGEKNYLTPNEAGEFLNRSVNAIRVMVCKKQIPYIKKGGKLYFLKSELIDYLESGRVEIEPTNAVDVLNKKRPNK